MTIKKAGIPLLQIDAFAAGPFTGNPAAVCLLEDDRPEEWMQKVAAEMNLSETAFVRAAGDAYRLRWFTPTVEVALCGHATVASAHALWETGRLREDQEARFDTLSGRLLARRRGALVEIDMPAMRLDETAAPEALRRALGAAPVRCLRTPDRGHGDWDYLLELDAEESVRGLRPDFAALRRDVTAGVVVTAPASRTKADFVSRYFAAAQGIDEDPVTGVAHCSLGPFWGRRLGRKEGEEMIGYQASARGGFVHVRLAGDRVRLAGEAVTVLRGELLH
jgi:PhzF family phenazine biosynthesis protein